MTKIFLALLALLVLSGCANRPQRLYEWGGYDSGLYAYYKSPNASEGFRTSMEAQFKELESRNQRPAPGLYAELGTLYLERGDRASAALYYQKERDTWPESRYLMDVMLKSLDRMKTGGKPQ